MPMVARMPAPSSPLLMSFALCGGPSVSFALKGKSQSPRMCFNSIYSKYTGSSPPISWNRCFFVCMFKTCLNASFYLCCAFSPYWTMHENVPQLMHRKCRHAVVPQNDFLKGAGTLCFIGRVVNFKRRVLKRKRIVEPLRYFHSDGCSKLSIVSPIFLSSSCNYFFQGTFCTLSLSPPHLFRGTALNKCYHKGDLQQCLGSFICSFFTLRLIR